MRFVLTLLAMITVLTTQTIVKAGEKEESESALQKGAELFESGRYNEAAELFQKAYDLNPSWEILLNIGQCSAAKKEYGRALEAFEAYLAKGGDDVPLQKRDEIIAEIRQFRERVGQLRAEGPDGAEIIVDGHSRGRFPLPGPLLVSGNVDHEVTVEMDGEVLMQKTVRVGIGDSQELTMEDQEGPRSEQDQNLFETDDTVEGGQRKKRSAGSAEPRRPPYSKPLRVSGWVISSMGVGLLIGGAIVGGITVSNDNKRTDGDCTGTKCDLKIKNLQITTNVLLGEGGVVAVAGATILIVSYIQQKRRAEKRAVSLLPVVNPKGFGFFLTHFF
jgi:hypothetical protein